MIDNLMQDGWSDDLRVHILAIGTATLGSWWRFHYSRAGHWRLYFQEGNGASLEFATGSLPLESGRLYLIPAGVPAFATHCIENANVRQYYFHFDITGLPDIALKHLFARAICLPQNAALESIVRDLFQDVTAKQQEFLLHWRIKAILYEGLTLYLKTLPASEAELCQQAALRVAPVLPALRHIQTHYAQPVSNIELSRRCSMSEDYFIRRFRECVGQSPGQYTLQFRLRMAAQRLLFTQVGIEQIALETGFCHRSHLTKAFHNHFGVSPRAYRSNPSG